MKYEAKRKIARDLAIAEYVAGHRDESLQEIGDIFGITKQGVSVILRKPYVVEYIAKLEA